MRSYRYRANSLLAALIAALCLGSFGAGQPALTSAVGVPGSAIPESADFATLELRDPWDMSQYTDVSQYLNESGQRSSISSPAMSDGLFTGRSVGNANQNNVNNAYFLPLFPGYETAMHLGKTGSRHPISSSTYHCLYIAMKVDSTAGLPIAPDQFRFFWFENDRLTNGTWGGAAGVPLYPEAGNGTPTPGYRLYRADLATAPRVSGNTNWNGRAAWQGIRIDPTVNAGITFAIDWVRLTTCAANNQNFTWTPNNSVTSLWLKRAGTNRFIRVATGLTGLSGGLAGMGTVDLQGVPPGSYTAAVGTNTTCCIEQSTSSVVINQTPIVEFVRPSFFSGVDYASQAGHPWNFDTSSDISRAINAPFSVSGGLLDTTTPSGPAPGGADPQFFLRLPQPIAPSNYRYLSFRLLTEWKNPWQNVPDGMIGRFVWLTQGSAGGGDRCYWVSQDIPIDIGWQTYWIDFGVAFNGTPEFKAGNCPGGMPDWTAAPPILDLRFDPNENITVAHNPPGGGGSFHQQIDWIRLTAIDRVTHGTPFAISIAVNRDVSRLTYYYTTNRSTPTQHTAQPYTTQAPAGNRRTFLPLVMAPGAAAALGGVPAANHTFMWNTASVAPNTYYICVNAAGGPNSATYCSEAPVIVQ